MKKNVILGVIASVFAIGSAFATLAPETASIFTKANANAQFVCTQTNVSCNNVGSTACTVKINTTLSGIKTVPGRSFNDGQCSPVLTNSTAAPTAAGTVYDAQ